MIILKITIRASTLVPPERLVDAAKTALVKHIEVVHKIESFMLPLQAEDHVIQATTPIHLTLHPHTPGQLWFRSSKAM